MVKDMSACFPFHSEKGSGWPSSEQVCGVFCSLIHCVPCYLSLIHSNACLVREAGIKDIKEKEENEDI